MSHKLINTLREVSPPTAARLAIAHAFLLVACICGNLPYIFLQLLLAAEMLLRALATLPFYRHRSLLSHALDMMKIIAGLIFVFIFILVGYAVGRSGDNHAMVADLMGLRDVGIADAMWALGYLILSFSISIRTAIRSTGPRKSWAMSNLKGAGATFISLFLMVFVALFVGKPIIAGLTWIGLMIDVDALLSTLMVIVRYVLALVMSTMSESEMDAILEAPSRPPAAPESG